MADASGGDAKKGWKPATKAVRGGLMRSEHGEIAEALYLTSGYAYDSAEHQAFLKRKSLDIVNSYYGAKDTAKILNDTVATYAKIFKESGQQLRKDMQ